MVGELIGAGGLSPRPITWDDWDRWSNDRSAAMAPLRGRRTELESQMRALESGGDTSDAAWARYQSLENERTILDVDERTAFPPHLSENGQFSPGDFRGYVEERAGGPEAFASMSPDQQRRYLATLAPEYEQMRAQEAARRTGERALDGTPGRAYGEVLAFGATITPVVGGGRGAACTTCTNPAPAPRPVSSMTGNQWQGRCTDLAMRLLSGSRDTNIAQAGTAREQIPAMVDHLRSRGHRVEDVGDPDRSLGGYGTFSSEGEVRNAVREISRSGDNALIVQLGGSGAGGVDGTHAFVWRQSRVFNDGFQEAPTVWDGQRYMVFRVSPRD